MSFNCEFSEQTNLEREFVNIFDDFFDEQKQIFCNINSVGVEHYK